MLKKLLNVTDDIPFEIDTDGIRSPSASPVVLFFPSTGYMAYFELVCWYGELTDTTGLVTGVYDNSEPRQLLYEISSYAETTFDCINIFHISSTGTHHVRIWPRFAATYETRDKLLE